MSTQATDIDRDPERAAIHANVIRLLQPAMTELGDEERSLLRERFLSERSAVELATKHGIPASTVRTRIRRSLAKLRAILDDHHRDAPLHWAPAFAAVPAPATPYRWYPAASGKGLALCSVVGAAVVGSMWPTGDRSPIDTIESEFVVAAAVADEGAAVEASSDEESRADRLVSASSLRHTGPGVESPRRAPISVPNPSHATSDAFVPAPRCDSGGPRQCVRCAMDNECSAQHEACESDVDCHALQGCLDCLVATCMPG